MNSLHIFQNGMLSRWKSTVIWSLSLLGMAILFAALFQSFSSEINEIADTYPESLQAFVGDITAAATPAGWLGVELYSLMVPFALAIIGIGFGSSAIGKEEDSGTLELLLASPISRTRILFEKALAIEVTLAVVAMSVWLGVAIGTLLFPFDVSLVDTFWASVMSWLLGMFFAFAALAIQAMTGKRSLSLGIGSVLLAATYLADVVSKLLESLDFLKYLSPFYYSGSPTVLLEGVNIVNVAGLTIVVGIFYILAHKMFIKRDTGV